MPNISVDIETIETVFSRCNQILTEISKINSTLKNVRQNMTKWQDKKVKEFQDVVFTCEEALNHTKRNLLDCIKKLDNLYAIALEYQSITFSKGNKTPNTFLKDKVNSIINNISSHVEGFLEQGNSYFFTEEGREISAGVGNILFTIFNSILPSDGHVSPSYVKESFVNMVQTLFPSFMNFCERSSSFIYLTQGNRVEQQVNNMFPFVDANGQRISSLELHVERRDRCNEAFVRDNQDVRMIDISNLHINSNIHNPEIESAVIEVQQLLNNYGSGMSIEDCYRYYPNAAEIVFGNNQVELHNLGEDTCSISSGEEIIATAINMSIPFFPVVLR
ncbi:MAG: hypothetical protein IJQ07_06700 [Clostridia bacterium]|nr:hypothetical protein [Clostridia bacterium]